MARAMKRVVDLTVAASALILLAPILGVIAFLVWTCDGRPIFFIQKRPGLHGTLFNLVKFRTMRAVRNDEVGIADHVRVTRLGSILRRTSLDELPQLWNVLRGDISLVGPRPLLPEYLEIYTPEQHRRHLVTPGLTGWAQIHGRNCVDWQERLALDIWYVDNWSFFLDLYILWRTFALVLSGRGTESSQLTPENRLDYYVRHTDPTEGCSTSDRCAA